MSVLLIDNYIARLQIMISNSQIGKYEINWITKLKAYPKWKAS